MILARETQRPPRFAFPVWHLAVVLAVLFSHAPLGAATSPGLHEAPPSIVRVVLDNNYPPYAFLDPEGRLQGILIDRWRLWEKRTGVPVEIVGLDWSEAIQRMRNGEFDVIDTIFWTEERSRFLDYSKPHTRIEVPIFFHRDLSGITDLKSLRDFPVGVKSGDAAVSMLRDAGVNSLVYFNNYEAIVRAAKLHRIQVFVMDKPAALYFLAKQGVDEQYRMSEPASVGEFHRGYRKGNLRLAAFVDAGFDKLTQSDFEAIDRKWLGTSSYPHLSTKTLAAGAGLTFCLLAVLGTWIFMLRWQVRKRTAALQDSERKFREALEFLPIPIGIANEQGEIQFLNHEFSSHFGYTTDDVRTVFDWYDRASPDSRSRQERAENWRRQISVSFSENRTIPKRTYRIVCKDGSLKEVEILSRPIDRFLLTTFNDVTEQNRAARELQQSESRYRRLHETMQDAYVRTDSGGMIVETNRAFREMLGYDEAELLSMSYSRITPGKWHPVQEAIIREQILPRGYSEVFEKEYVRKDGTVIPVELRVFLLREDSGEVGMWAIVRETTERKRLELQLIQAQKMEAIGQLAGGVAHDFNNILASILLNTSLLQYNSGIDDAVRQSLNTIKADVDKASGLTKQLLSFSRRQSVQLSAIDLNILVSNSLGMLRRLLGERVQIEFQSQDDLPCIMGNSGMLDQVVMNLCLNARDAMPEGGRLKLQTSQLYMRQKPVRDSAGSTGVCFVRLSVTDTGVGMSPELCQKIFEPFFTTKEVGKGTGLGLSIVFGIVKQHGGSIDVESTPGVGSTFHVNLPAAMLVPGDARKESDEEIVPGHGESVLLVEDEAALRSILAAGLKSLGYSVQCASCPAEALELWSQREKDFDLLLTDMIMPGGITGLELAKTLATQQPGLRIIIASGYHKEFDDATLPSGIKIRKLRKPFPLGVLSRQVHDILSS